MPSRHPTLGELLRHQMIVNAQDNRVGSGAPKSAVIKLARQRAEGGEKSVHRNRTVTIVKPIVCCTKGALVDGRGLSTATKDVERGAFSP